jgi:hypothetical protein
MLLYLSMAGILFLCMTVATYSMYQYEKRHSDVETSFAKVFGVLVVLAVVSLLWPFVLAVVFLYTLLSS